MTVEANPDSMTDAFLSQTCAAGVNRLSMGIQSAQDAFFRARQAGFDNLSVDLM